MIMNETSKARQLAEMLKQRAIDESEEKPLPTFTLNGMTQEEVDAENFKRVYGVEDDGENLPELDWENAFNNQRDDSEQLAERLSASRNGPVLNRTLINNIPNEEEDELEEPLESVTW